MPLPEDYDYEPAYLNDFDDVSFAVAEKSQIDFDIEFYDHILQRNPNYIDVLRRQGELLTRKGEHDRAIEVDRRLVALLPNDEIVYYNLACSLARRGHENDAIEALRTALKLGYTDIEYLESDADLDALRDHPRYHALLSAYKDCG